MVTRKRDRTQVAWHKVFLALSALSTALLGLAMYDVPPFGDLTPVGVSALVVALFAAASVAYWYDLRRRRRRTEDAPPDLRETLGEEVSYRENGIDGEERTGEDDRDGRRTSDSGGTDGEREGEDD